jgi:hypothetical protein
VANDYKMLEAGHDLLLPRSVGQSPHWKYRVKYPDALHQINLANSRLITNNLLTADTLR